MKKLPIGISDFKAIVDNGFYYADKSLFIKDVIDASSRILLITRPRRYGKSVNLSMLRYFLEMTENNESNPQLFKNLVIAKEASMQKYMGASPVIFLSLKNVKRVNWKTTYSKFVKIIRSEFERHAHILDSDKLSDEYRQYINHVLNNSLAPEQFPNCLKVLSQALFQYYGKKAYVLIDEYDKPLYVRYPSEFYDRITDFLSQFFTATFTGNHAVEKAVITGITPLSNDTLFAQSNSLQLLSVLDDAFSTYFGFEQTELEAIVTQHQVNTAQFSVDGIGRWYKNSISKGEAIYNPWSVLHVVGHSSDKFQAYWINSSVVVYIKEQFIKSSPAFKLEFAQLLVTGKSECKLTKWVDLASIVQNDQMLWSFMAHCGYIAFEQSGGSYKLSIPNLEVKEALVHMLMKWFQECMDTAGLQQILFALLQADTETFEKKFGYFAESIATFYKVHDEQNSLMALLLVLVLQAEENACLSLGVDVQGAVYLVRINDDKNSSLLAIKLPVDEETNLEAAGLALKTALTVNANARVRKIGASLQQNVVATALEA